MAVITVTRMRPGTASCQYTRKMIPKVPVPMLRAASILPGSTPASTVSTCLVKKGTVPKMSGTMAPATPIAVPTSARVKGIRKIRRIRKGIARKKLISAFRTVYGIFRGRMPSLFQTVSSVPRNKPITKEMLPAIRNIWSVASQLVTKRSQ